MRRFPLVVMAVVALGCKDAIPVLTLDPTDTANVTGTFQMLFDNGTPLPVPTAVSTVQEEDLVADQLILSSDNSWAETSSFVITSQVDGSQTSQTNHYAGTYAIANGAINFTVTAGASVAFMGSLKGDTLNVLENGSHYIYQR